MENETITVPMKDFDALRAYVRNVRDGVLDDDLFTDAPERAGSVRHLRSQARRMGAALGRMETSARPTHASSETDGDAAACGCKPGTLVCREPEGR